MSFEIEFYLFLGFWDIAAIAVCLWINRWTKNDEQGFVN